MSIHTHINSLAEKRAHLKQQISQEMAHPSPDLTLITTMKKQNLALKEEMQRYLVLLGKNAADAS